MQRTSYTVTTADHVTISFDRLGNGRHEAVVLICPGFFQSKETATFRRLAQTLAEGRDVLAMDFRGHGRSSGLYTFSAKEHADLEAVLDWTKVRYQRMSVLGFSLGAAIAINALSRSKTSIQSLVAVSAPASFEEIEFKWWTSEAMRTGLDGLEPGAGCRPGNPLLKKEQPLANVSSLSPIPILFIHGTRDVIVGVEHSRRLYAAARQPKQLEIIEGGSHAEALFRDTPEDFGRLVEAWPARGNP